MDEAATQFGIWCRRASPLFANQEQQSREAATFACEAYHAKLQLVDTIVQETEEPFLTGSRVTIADCIAMATLQFAEHFYGVPLPDTCRSLADWYAAFASRPGATLPTYPKPLLALAHGLQQVRPPTFP